MAKRPTIYDLAKAANVSTATVDRVINGRHKVRKETARRVYDAAHEIGYHAAGLIKQRIQENLPHVKFGFILHKPQHYFYQQFAEKLAEAVRVNVDIQGQCEVAWAEATSPKEFAELIERMSKTCDVIAAVATDCLQVSTAVEQAKARGVATFSLLSDFAQDVRAGYFGTNNLKVGRSAGWMIANTAKKAGKVGLFVGGSRWHGHELRETGFRSYFREHAPQFQVIESVTNLETRKLTYEATLELLHKNPDLVGLYSAGGGMEGSLIALCEEARDADMTVVVNEIMPETVSGLAEGLVTAVLATPLDDLCRKLVDYMGKSVTDKNFEVPSQTFFPMRLHIPESM